MPKDTSDGTYVTCSNCGNTIDTENGTTVSSEIRWKYIGTVLSAITVTSLTVVIMLAGIGIFSLSAIGQGWALLYSTVVLMAATWVFGEKTLKAVKQARGN